MKTIVRISVIASEFGQEVFDDLVRSCPEAMADKFELWFEGEVDAPATARVLSCFERHGIVRWEQKAARERGKEFVAYTLMRWEESDIESAEYLEIARENALLVASGGPRLPNKLLRMQMGPLRGRKTIVLARAFVISHRVKLILEAEGFQRLEFRPVQMTELIEEGDPNSTRHYEKSIDNLKEPQKWWEMTSSFILPPFEPPVEKHAIASLPIDKDGLGPLIPRTPGLDDFQARYRRSALRAAGPFDAAVSLEYAADPLSKCCFFVSQRLRKVLLTREPSLTFTPMGIVEDL